MSRKQSWTHGTKPILGRQPLKAGTSFRMAIPSTFAFLLIGWAVTGAAQPAPPPVTDPAAASAAPSPGVGPYQAGADPAQPGDPAQRANADSSTAAPPGAQPPVCFKLTQRCLDSKSGSGTSSTGKAGQASTSKAAQASSSKNESTPQHPLNLNAPDVRSVVPAEELREPLETPEQEAAAEDAATVQVKGESDAPDVPGGFGALWWAMKHPSEAWRILAPVE